MLRRFGLLVRRLYRRPGARYRPRAWPVLSPRAARRLLAWFEQHAAPWPWRDPGTTPFGRLLAEMLLRQTRASHVARVWPALVQRYPTPGALLAAPEPELQALLKPLGLAQQRTAALRAAARHLVAYHGGQVPTHPVALAAIPHVGPYTANAVACFSFGLPVPIVDVNVLRILSRYTGWQPRTHNPHREALAWQQASRWLPPAQVVQFNYALLDLAHQVCTRNRPRCHQCPLRPGCGHPRGLEPDTRP